MAPTGDGIRRLVIETKKPIEMTKEEVEHHPMHKRFSDLKDERGLEHPPLVGWVAIPVLDGEQEVLGVVQLSDKSDGEFTEADVDLLERVGRLMLPAFTLRHVNEQITTRIEARTTELAASNEALRESNSRLDEFTHAASHDLQAPLRPPSASTSTSSTSSSTASSATRPNRPWTGSSPRPST